MSAVTPTQLLAWTRKHGWPFGPVAVDTETSGLHPDDGARVSTVSIAWEGKRASEHPPAPAHTSAWEGISPQRRALIASCAWPFDQGLDGKALGVAAVQPSLFDEQGEQGEQDEQANLDSKQWRALQQWLALVGENSGLVFHNAPFDVRVIRAGTRHDTGIDLTDWVHWDTQLINALIWPTATDEKGGPTTSLKPTAARLWGAAETDEQAIVKAYLKANKLPAGRWDLMPWSVVGKYAEQDARLTIRLYLRQYEGLATGREGQWLDKGDGMGTGWRLAVDRRMAVCRTICRMERRGLPYDRQLSLQIADEITDRIAKATSALPFKPATLPAAKRWFFGPVEEGGLGLTPYSLTGQGEPSLTEQDVARLVKDGAAGAEVWRDVQKMSRAKSMWYEGYAQAVGQDGRLRTSFRQTGTVSGRFSVERVNLQAIPQDYRLSDHACLDGLATPRGVVSAGARKIEGWQQWELDLAQAELRVAALYAGCDPMLEMITTGADLHSVTSQEIFKAGPEHEMWELYRQVGKRANFSLIFGAGGSTFQAMIAKQVGLYLSDAESDSIVRSWNALYPQYGRAIDLHMRRVERRQLVGRGWIGTHGGERRWFRRYEDVHKAFNQRVQGALALLGQRWMVAVDQMLMDEGVGLEGDGLLLTIHDSLVLLLPQQDAQRLADQASQIGIDIWNQMFPGIAGGIDAKRWDK